MNSPSSNDVPKKTKRRVIRIKKKKDKTTPEELYIRTFTDKERKAYEIAKDHLQSSFSMKKSIGFTKWTDSQEAKEISH